MQPITTPTERDVFARAFALRHLWEGDAHGLNKADVLALGLLLQLIGPCCLRVAEGCLRARLTIVFTDAGFEAVDVAEAPPAEMDLADGARFERIPVLWLGPLGDVPSDGAVDVFLLYGLREGLDTRVKPRLPDARLMPLSSQAPALWQCGLVWATASDTAPISMCLDALARLMASDWLDPLKLFEATQMASTQPPPPITPEGTEDVEALKARVRELEQIGFVRHEIEVAKAVDRERRLR